MFYYWCFNILIIILKNTLIKCLWKNKEKIDQRRYARYIAGSKLLRQPYKVSVLIKHPLKIARPSFAIYHVAL